ncbi:MAG: diguanylate cyclase [Deltaproteobacteria bacterium]|nr:diguanylate cyclase [Deltaproteobacteria bacterium]
MIADSWDDDTTATTSVDDLATPPARSAGKPCLTVLTGALTGQVFTLAHGKTVFGRSPEAHIRIVDDGISRKHAQITHHETLMLEDLGSRNGTFVNGERITISTPLKEGDKIQLGGTTVLRLANHDELDESFLEKLVSSAVRDPLTQLYNKRYLMDRLDSELKFAQRHETALTVLMLDLDHFKRVNDDHGHLAGDAVLVDLASVLVRALRNEDVVARFGGEEIVIILRAIPIEIGANLGERLRRLVEQSVTSHQGHQLRSTVSIGVASFPSTRAETAEQLLEAADQALYRAKHAGRNRLSR